MGKKLSDVDAGVREQAILTQGMRSQFGLSSPMVTPPERARSNPLPPSDFPTSYQSPPSAPSKWRTIIRLPMVRARIPLPLHSRLRAYLRGSGRTVSEVIREGLERVLPPVRGLS